MPAEERLNLLARAPHGRRRAHDLGWPRSAVDGQLAEVVHGGLVQANHGSEWTADEVELVLDDELRGQQPFRHRLRPQGRVIHDAVGALLVDVGRPAKEHPRVTTPGHHRELVDGRDQKGRDLLVDLLVHEEHREPQSRHLRLRVRAARYHPGTQAREQEVLLRRLAPPGSTSLMFWILIASPHHGQPVSGKGESVRPGV